MDARLLRTVVAAVALLALGAVVGAATNLGLTLLGAPVALGTPVGVAVAVTVILPLADAYTLLGRGVDTDTLRERGRARLAAEVAFAAVGAMAVSGLLAAGVYTADTAWAFALVVAVGVAVGYGTFVLRNRAYYAAA
ncbi:hypothetical protein J2752_000907 [Halarchaeum rubridurum]|uniref:Uncharacterized protein n=1 Tax=Halarchaeum rubridurum TaxID=489911 RepID=A0A830FT08_9EURY|nr:hypothetical protein [Halarchaeum rubridurum]MBP1954026.1 hypothetical protein [Halarchaeum rubridurum]GGM56765.1 hypothetical protein GCM10009017_03650 [Halarchaeum rubridurum]